MLVLGGDGMLGSMVSRVLRRSPNLDVAATSRRPGAAVPLDAEGGVDAVQRACARLRAGDYAINCVGVLKSAIREDDPESIECARRINSVFPAAVANVAASKGVRVIHVSTDAVFADGAGVCDEETVADASDTYGRSKLAGELESLNVLNVRCSIIGPDSQGRRGLLEWFLARRAGERVAGFADHAWNGVTTLQFAEACRRIVDQDAFERLRNAGGVHHLCAGAAVTKAELLDMIRDVFDVPVEIDVVAAPNGPITRTLATRFAALHATIHPGMTIRRALTELAADMRSQSTHTP